MEIVSELLKEKIYLSKDIYEFLCCQFKLKNVNNKVLFDNIKWKIILVKHNIITCDTPVSNIEINELKNKIDIKYACECNLEEYKKYIINSSNSKDPCEILNCLTSNSNQNMLNMIFDNLIKLSSVYESIKIHQYFSKELKLNNNQNLHRSHICSLATFFDKLTNFN